MINTLALKHDGSFDENIPIDNILNNEAYKWCWIDFYNANEKEISYLSDIFHFHKLAIDECMHRVQRPKLEYYDNYTFFALQSRKMTSFKQEDITLFMSDKYIVSFHKDELLQFEKAQHKIQNQDCNMELKDTTHLVYLIISEIADGYFPLIYDIEDRLDDLQDSTDMTSQKHIDMVFEIKADLRKLNHTIIPMRDLVYRILNSDHLHIGSSKLNKNHFENIHHHLVKLSQMIERNSQTIVDYRDSFISINGHKLNRSMATLTAYSVIFMPLSFLVGLYGMNFQNMPELHTQYGYFVLLCVMLIISVSMFFYFRKNGWFRKD
jgi:magnesium transporter